MKRLSIAPVLAVLVAALPPLAPPAFAASASQSAHATKRAPATVTLPDGLTYVDRVVGRGAQPKPGQTVVVHYVGTLKNGEKFDSSRDRHEPFKFPLGERQVIAGWDEGVATMRVGGRRTLIIPAKLGYGEEGAGGGKIPPGATLIFDIELLGVE